jgi:NADPH:quinone reductase-like Zn-dependent oxidoreductase
VLPLFKNETLKPVISNVFKMTEARAAFEAMASNLTFGKTILTW